MIRGEDMAVFEMTIPVINSLGLNWESLGRTTAELEGVTDRAMVTMECLD